MFSEQMILDIHSPVRDIVNAVIAHNENFKNMTPDELNVAIPELWKAASKAVLESFQELTSAD